MCAIRCEDKATDQYRTRPGALFTPSEGNQAQRRLNCPKRLPGTWPKACASSSNVCRAAQDAAASACSSMEMLPDTLQGYRHLSHHWLLVSECTLPRQEEPAVSLSRLWSVSQHLHSGSACMCKPTAIM